MLGKKEFGKHTKNTLGHKLFSEFLEKNDIYLLQKYCTRHKLPYRYIYQMYRCYSPLSAPAIFGLRKIIHPLAWFYDENYNPKLLPKYDPPDFPDYELWSLQISKAMPVFVKLCKEISKIKENDKKRIWRCKHLLTPYMCENIAKPELSWRRTSLPCEIVKNFADEIPMIWWLMLPDENDFELAVPSSEGQVPSEIG